MSDALNDIRQDERINEQLNKILKIEEEFLKKPSKEKAKEIIKMYSNYMNMGGGYNHSPSKSYSREKISVFGEWINGESKLEELKKYLEAENSKVAVQVATGYWGFSNLSLERMVLDMIQEDYSNGSLLGKKVFIEIKKGKNELKIKYSLVPEDYEKKRLERINKCSKYLDLLKR